MENDYGVDFEDSTSVWDYLVNYDYFTDDELRLVQAINGYSLNTLNDCIYVRYGYHSLEQLLESEEQSV